MKYRGKNYRSEKEKVEKIKYVYVLDEWIIPRTGIVCNKNKKNIDYIEKRFREIAMVSKRPW